MKNESKLNQTQLNHANNRLTQIYQKAFARFQNINYANVVDFDNPKEVAALQKEAKLTSPDVGRLLKALFTGSISYMPDEEYRRVNQILIEKAKKAAKVTKDKVPKAQQILLETQDKLLFGELEAKQVPELLKEFENQLTELVSA